MTFVKPSGNHNWYFLSEGRLYDFYHHFFVVDEESESWLCSIQIEANDWHDLYKKTGYCPFRAHYSNDHIWIDTLGCIYQGYNKESSARNIGEVLYGKLDVDAEWLEVAGWIWLTKDDTLHYHISNGFYDHITQTQEEALRLWAKANKIHTFDNERWA